jgi:carbon storage regulator
MLVLSRKKGESIVIGEGIEVIVLDVQGDTIKLGISAPKHVEVYRKELYISIQESNKEASQGVISPSALSDIFKKNKKTY